MTTFEQPRHRARRARFGIGTVAGKITGLIQNAARRRKRRKGLLALREMEDWQLRDIGVSRSAVEDALSARK